MKQTSHCPISREELSAKTTSSADTENSPDAESMMDQQ